VGKYILAESTNSLTALLDKVIDLYRGHFLPADAGQFWTISYRERLRSRYFRLITTAGEGLEMAGQWEKALKYYRKGIEIDELSEEYYQRLMICYQKLSRQADAIEVYKHYARLLSMKMGIEPSTRTKAIYEKLGN
jgi:two-component SAPR family response regulator